MQNFNQKQLKSPKRRPRKLKERYNEDVIKRTDKKENVERIMKVQEYQKQKLMEKIEEKMTKAEHIKREREQLLDQRQVMKKEIEKQKRDMMEKIEKLKQGKIDPNELLKSLSMETSQKVTVTKTETIPVSHNTKQYNIDQLVQHQFKQLIIHSTHLSPYPFEEILMFNPNNAQAEECPHAVQPSVFSEDAKKEIRQIIREEAKAFIREQVQAIMKEEIIGLLEDFLIKSLQKKLQPIKSIMVNMQNNVQSLNQKVKQKLKMSEKQIIQ